LRNHSFLKKIDEENEDKKLTVNPPQPTGKCNTEHRTVTGDAAERV